MELFKAANQWAERPADERFWTLEEALQATREYRKSAIASRVPFNELRVEADNGEVKIVGKKNLPARLTNWSFGQVAVKVGAPAGYLRNLPATLAAQNLNHGFAKLGQTESSDAALLFHKNGDYVLRAVTSPSYTRIWNDDIIERLQANLPTGWRVPPARPAGLIGERTRVATEADVISVGSGGGQKIGVGDLIAPAGIYASDHDLFLFLIQEGNTINDGTGHGLNRGFFLGNSEVGASSFYIRTFLFDGVCGNHIVWGASNVEEFRIRHIGTADTKAFQEIRVELKKYADSSASDLELKIKRARAYTFDGVKKEDVLEAIFAFAKKAKADLNRTTIAEAFQIAENTPRYGSPSSVWGIVNGVTELSQKTDYTDERIALDRAAGKLLEVEF